MDFIESGTYYQLLLPFIFPIVMFGIVITLIYFISGWKQFYKSYPFNLQTKPTDMISWKSARIGLISFNNAINFGFSQYGLYIKPVRLFSFGLFRPLLLPWTEITWHKKQKLGFTFMEIIPKKAGTKTITISNSLYETMKPKLENYTNIKSSQNNEF